MSTFVTGQQLCQKRRTFAPHRGAYLWIIAFSAIALSVNSAMMLKDTGTFYQGTPVTNGNNSLTHSTLYDFNVFIHMCSRDSNCNYVIYDKRNNAMKMYKNERDFPDDEKLQQVWLKQSRKHKYMVVTEKLNWHEARAKCQAYFGDLASITSKEEEKSYAKLLAGFSHNTAFWIGLNDIDNERTFVWSDGRTKTYTSWSYGEPNHYDGEDCSAVTPLLKWNDAYCHFLFFFVCRVPVAGTSIERSTAVFTFRLGV